MDHIKKITERKEKERATKISKPKNGPRDKRQEKVAENDVMKGNEWKPYDKNIGKDDRDELCTNKTCSQRKLDVYNLKCVQSRKKVYCLQRVCTRQSVRGGECTPRRVVCYTTGRKKTHR